MNAYSMLACAGTGMCSISLLPCLAWLDSTGQYFGLAGPLSDGASLSFSMDTNGLRHIKIDSAGPSGCLSLGDLINSLGVPGVSVPPVFTICGPSVQIVPAYAGRYKIGSVISVVLLLLGTQGHPIAWLSFCHMCDS